MIKTNTKFDLWLQRRSSSLNEYGHCFVSLFRSPCSAFKPVCLLVLFLHPRLRPVVHLVWRIPCRPWLTVVAPTLAPSRLLLPDKYALFSYIGYNSWATLTTAGQPLQQLGRPYNSWHTLNLNSRYLRSRCCQTRQQVPSGKDGERVSAVYWYSIGVVYWHSVVLIQYWHSILYWHWVLIRYWHVLLYMYWHWGIDMVSTQCYVLSQGFLVSWIVIHKGLLLIPQSAWLNVVT